jgi:hypothetical protein
MAVESQTLQFNSHKMLLNNFVRDVFCDTKHHLSSMCFFVVLLKNKNEWWWEIDALRLHYVVINIAEAKHSSEKCDEFIMQNAINYMNKLNADGQRVVCVRMLLTHRHNKVI